MARDGNKSAASRPANQRFKELFAAEFRDVLVKRFGRIPTAETIASEFNVRAMGTETISIETARRWLRGLRLPNAAHLRVLSGWLGVEFSKSSNAEIRLRDSSASQPIKDANDIRRTRNISRLDEEEVNRLARAIARENIDRLMMLLERSKTWLSD